MASDVKDIEFTEYELFGSNVIVSYERVDKSTIPKGFYCYDIRHSDYSWVSPATIEEKVAVNWYGTIISREPIELNSNKDNPEDHYRKVNLKNFKEIADKVSFAEWSEHKRLKAVVVEPMERPQAEFIDGSYEGMRNIVGGLLEVVHPFSDDNVVVVVNEEGKLLDLPPNRFLEDENTKEPFDVLYGTFFVVGDGGDEFESLTDKQVKRYMKYYDKGMLVELTLKEQYKSDKKKEPER